jgi:hypothetical protein
MERAPVDMDGLQRVPGHAEIADPTDQVVGLDRTDLLYGAARAS